MAMSMTHALRMVRAVQAAGTTMLVNWPMTWSPASRKAKALVEAGAIGRVLEIKWRGGHTGPLGSGAKHEGVTQEAAPLTATELGATWWHYIAPGGGAMLDYCCYGAMVSFWYIGERGLAAVAHGSVQRGQWRQQQSGEDEHVFHGLLCLIKFVTAFTAWNRCLVQR
jgi:predicted dehydrogenase